MRTLLPGENNMGTYSKAKTILRSHRDDTVEKIDCCVNMCVAYFDCSSPELQSRDFQNSHRSFCPECGEKRYCQDGKTPRRYFFYLPFHHWLQDLFMKPDLHPHLLNDIGPMCFPDGDVRRSRGWKRKMVDNPNINADSRNQGLIASTDGVPYFKDLNSASGWPVVVRSANLPHGLWNDYSYCHLSALIPSEFVQDKTRIKRYISRLQFCVSSHNKFVFMSSLYRDPPSLQCVLLRLVDELLLGQNRGFPMKDFNISPVHPEHYFLLKTVLLFFVGDYPGLAKVSCFKHAGYYRCHWCVQKFVYFLPGHMVSLDNRKHLRDDHPFRDDPSFGPSERGGRPSSRNHSDVVSKKNLCHFYCTN